MGDWKKMLPRGKTGLIPTYMDKNINSRIGIDHLNLKMLEMNCFDIKQPKQQKQEIQKKAVFVE
jgi:hypothetical protein